MASGRYDVKSLPHHGLHLRQEYTVIIWAENAVGKGVEFMKNVRHRWIDI